MEEKQEKKASFVKTFVKSVSKIVGIIAGVFSFIFLPLFLVLFISIFLSLLLSLRSDGAVLSNVSSNNGECGFTISKTSLSKSEFKSKIQEYANTHSQWQVFADNADDYYDYAKSQGVNPEIVVTIASKEGNGYTTSGSNNYWGLACPNGASSCGSYGSFMEGAKLLIQSASKYSSLMDWFDVGHYSWIGDYWYNPGDWGLGGCAYASYIYPDNMPARVKNACGSGAPYCGSGGGSGCVKTEPEDQTAYAKWLINDKMAIPREYIFGLKANEGVACTSSYGSYSSDVVESYVSWMIDFSKDDSHGYSQATRDTNPNVDCSSFVYYGLVDGAKLDKATLGETAFSTHSMDSTLTDTGFTAHDFSSLDTLKRGDILWRAEHTEVYVGDGKCVGAHTNKDGVDGDSSGEEVNVSTCSSNWTRFYRYQN